MLKNNLLEKKMYIAYVSRRIKVHSAKEAEHQELEGRHSYP